MIDLSLPGLLGAIAGTIVAGVLYHLFIGHFERAVRERQRSETPEQQATSELTLSIVRRTVLTVDLFAFAAVGYWLGLTFGE